MFRRAFEAQYCESDIAAAAAAAYVAVLRNGRGLKLQKIYINVVWRTNGRHYTHLCVSNLFLFLLPIYYTLIRVIRYNHETPGFSMLSFKNKCLFIGLFLQNSLLPSWKMSSVWRRKKKSRFISFLFNNFYCNRITCRHYGVGGDRLGIVWVL